MTLVSSELREVSAPSVVSNIHLGPLAQRSNHDALTPLRRLPSEKSLANAPSASLRDSFCCQSVPRLARLATEGFGNQPPVAYRALEFLVDQGLAHRIQRLNAFTACVHPGEDHAPAFLICRTCHMVAEAEASAARASLEDEAARAGFQVERSTIEALGLCPNCRGTA